MKKHAVVVAAYAVLAVALVADRPAGARPERRRADATADVEAMRARLLAPTPIPELRPNPVALRESARLERLAAESGRLARAMEGYSREVDGLAPEATARLDLSGLARWLVWSAELGAGEGLWLPLGRAKAPAFLASIARHEVSWRRRRAPRGPAGEGCALQVAPSTAGALGFSPREVATDRVACFRAARAALEHCARKCGEVPAEGWLGCYATRGGLCGGVPDVVAPRFETARDLLRRSSPGETPPTG